MDVDKPLDELVAANKKARRGAGRRGGAGRSNVGQRGAGGARNKYAGAVPSQKGQAATSGSKKNSFPTSTKVIVSNLPLDVTSQQITDLFATQIGPIGRASLACNEKGKSIGTVTIEFKKAEHAAEAFKQFNGRMIDQKKPMKVEIVVDPLKAPPQTLADRMAPAPKDASTSTRGKKAGRGGGRGGRGGKGLRGERAVPKTAEQLDAEMDQFMATTA